MIVLVDYGMGNINSVLKALKRIGYKAIASSKKEDIESADRLILPGVGHFKKGMENLRKLDLIEILNKKVIKEKTPILGICLGMQLLTNRSEEGCVAGFGWIKGDTVKFRIDKKFKIPHIGWNNIKIEKENPIFSEEADQFYFAHSFHVIPKNEENILLSTDYGGKFVSGMQKENILGVQFHPEKSHESGLEIIKKFIDSNNV
jgi:glutamine amidotransferase